MFGEEKEELCVRRWEWWDLNLPNEHHSLCLTGLIIISTIIFIISPSYSHHHSQISAKSISVFFYFILLFIIMVDFSVCPRHSIVHCVTQVTDYPPPFYKPFTIWSCQYMSSLSSNVMYAAMLYYQPYFPPNGHFQACRQGSPRVSKVQGGPQGWVRWVLGVGGCAGRGCWGDGRH